MRRKAETFYGSVVGAFLQDVLEFASYNKDENGPLPVDLAQVQAKLIGALEVIMGKRRGPLFPDGPYFFKLPVAFRLTNKENRIDWIPMTDPIAPEWNLPREWVIPRVDTIYATAALLRADKNLRSRLRRCDECGRFFMAKGDHRRAHNFHDEACRRTFDKKHRDPEKQREYMRAYRRRKKEESKRRGRKKDAEKRS